MSVIAKIDLGLDSTGKGGDSQRTAFIKCNDNFEAIVGVVNASSQKLDESIESNNQKLDESITATNQKLEDAINSTNQKLEATIDSTNQKLDESIESNNQKLDEAVLKFALKGDNDDISSLQGLTKNIIQPSDASDEMGTVTLRQLKTMTGQLPNVDKANVWKQAQTVEVGSFGTDGLVLNTNTYLNNSPPVGTVFRAPSVVSKASNLGTGFHAKFFCEESYGDTTRAVIELKGWGGNFHWWTFSASGNAFADGAWINSSDERLKEDFKPIADGSILEKAVNFRGYTFIRKKTKEECAGFKAQEIQKILPEAVIEIGDTKQDEGILENTLGLDYGAMSAFNHECILALIQRLEKAEKTIAELQEKLNG